jgi:hypothetical protein
MFLALVLDKRAKSCFFPRKKRLFVEVRVTTRVVLLILIKRNIHVVFGEIIKNLDSLLG